MLDALWLLVSREKVNLANVLIFLPSRRAVRGAEKMFVSHSDGAIILPKLVALGEGTDDISDIDGVENLERVTVLAKLLASHAHIKNITTALPIAHDFVRMADYLDNEGVNVSDINWESLIDEKYAAHFKSKAELLNVLTIVMPKILNGAESQTHLRNEKIRAWRDEIKQSGYDLVVVCGSTASVPATADLMEFISRLPNGRIILSGKIDGDTEDFLLDTNPYNSEYKFLSRIGLNYKDVQPIDVGKSAIDFFNFAFSNNTTDCPPKCDISNCHLVVADRESEEANAVAQITKQALEQNKTVMVITPDAAGNQRIATAFNNMDIVADFSGGHSAAASSVSRALLNMFDELIENHDSQFVALYAQNQHNLFKTISDFVMTNYDNFSPLFLIDDAESLVVWNAIKKLSDCLDKYEIVLSMHEIRTFLYDVLSTTTVRDMNSEDADVVVLGTMEARMQTADVVILTGLNDGMFPAQGYENSWLPLTIAKQIGLPSRDRKISLMALDFINLSCGADVYWLRSGVSGNVQTSESRFLSRVIARGGNFDSELGKTILQSVRDKDNVTPCGLDYSAPIPPVDFSDVYVTELELLIHNPYAFYARHILRLHPKDDYWMEPDAREFGNLVHSVIENAKDFEPSNLIQQMDELAKQILGENNLLFHFWHKRFVEIADVLKQNSDVLTHSVPEIGGSIVIQNRNVRARADRVWDGGVLDIKTGTAPNKKQLLDGNMPQLPLEAFMLQSGGFKIKTSQKSQTPVTMFLQLKNSNVKPIIYDEQETADMINASVAKTTALFNMYSSGNVPYEYYKNSEPKYRVYDDLKRIDD